MPLRDHFHPGPGRSSMWDRVHGTWPAIVVMALNAKLPSRYVAAPHIHLGGIEIDVSTLRKDDIASPDWGRGSENGGVATEIWAPPTFEVATNSPDFDEYEVLIHDEDLQRLVAAIEIVSPSNKDREESRTAFASKCNALLHKQVSVAIVDVVTSRHFNLYGELLNLLGQADSGLAEEPPHVYASACRWMQVGAHWRFQAWNHTLGIGKVLPTIPLWLAEDLVVPLDLEATYEDTCRALRMA